MGLSRINRSHLLLVCFLLAACQSAKYLPEGEKFYVGATVKLVSSKHIKNERHMKAILKNAIRPQPNKSFLGIRPKLWMFWMSKNSSVKILNKWFNKNWKEPVLMSNINKEKTSEIIDAQLFNLGIFNSQTKYQVVEKKHTAKVTYISNIHTPYIIKSLTYSISDDRINQILLADHEKKYLRPGDTYHLQLLKDETQRIDALLKNNGYFYFSPDLLVFKADTIEVDHSVSFRLVLKDSIPVNALTPYSINKVLIDQDYSLSTDSTSKQKDTVSYQHNLFLVTKSEKAIRPNVLLGSVYLKKGEIYSRENHEITLNRLMSMEHFKFVSVKFVDSDTMASGFLDVRIWMTPMTKRTVKAEIDLVSKSNNFMGPKMDIGYLNRNTFHGAERLSLNLAGSFEAQVGKQNQFSYSLMPQAELSFPEIRIPFTKVRTNSLYTPQTIILLSYKYLKRLNYFDGNIFQLTYGFKWKQKKTTEEELKPFMVSYVSFSNKSTAFNNLLAGNPFLKKNYEEQFIAGSSYDFTYNEEMKAERKMQYFFHLTMETSGNAISLAEAIVGKNKSSSKTSTVFGSVYSQYAKISVESRAYYNFSSKDKLALRLFAGFAKPYGNSSAMPYSKQFFSGGPNSIRAFQVNSIGPGTYHQNTDNKGLFQLGGDVKLETNAEYRFDILRFLKGAFFIDGGNVWLLKPNTALSTKDFSLSGILDEVAVGAGFGLRLDLNFFILRFDLALPLKEPWLEKNHQWVIKQINFADPSWRSDNLVLNVAIGYPF